MSAVPLAICSMLMSSATPATACAPITYADTVAEARVRTPEGWRRVHLEASGQRLRLEYASKHSPTGRVAVIGIADSTEVFWFPVGPGPAQGHVARRTSWDSVHNALGLPPPRTLWDRYAADWAPVRSWGAHRCQPAIGNWGYDGTYDNTVCIRVEPGADGVEGLPLYVLDARGRTAFEITDLKRRALPAARFTLPAAREQRTAGISCGAVKLAR